MARMRFAELRKAVQSLSRHYVERRDRLQRGDALATAGRRAAFALYYGPLHFLLLARLAVELRRRGLAPEEVCR